MLRARESRRRARPDLALLLPPAVLALLGCALLLQRPSLWYDELFTAHVAPLPLSRLASAVLSGEGTVGYLRDIPPSYNAPYYVVAHAWLALTGQEAGDLSLRSLSLVASVLAVLVLTRAAARLGGRQVGLAAGLLAAVNPLVLEYAVEARGYGLAMLATAATALALARWLDGSRLWPYAAAATAAGLAHWYALPVVAGLALAAVLLRRRAAVPVVAVTAAASLPALALVTLAAAQVDAGLTIGFIRDTGGAVPWLSLQAWTAGSALLLGATLLAAAAALAAPRSPRTAVVAACWVATPLLLVTLAELVRPVFVPRYMLPALLGLALLAAAGLAGRRGSALLVGGLAVVSLVAAVPLLDRLPREDARAAVAALEALHGPGQPVVAVDPRAALALEHYAGRALRADLRLPPDDPPAADVVWLLRMASPTGLERSDDDAVLAAHGLRVESEQVFRGSNTQLVLQRWTRPPPH